MSVRTRHQALTSRGPRADAGFTLLEVLVALVVLSIGLLGVGKLMLVASRANDSAYLRSQATALAYGIFDTMRSNRLTALTGNYNVNPVSGVANPGFDCATATCSSAQIAQYDLYKWQGALTQALGPSGDGTITTNNVIDPVSGSQQTLAVITVQWNDQVAQQTINGVAAAANQVITLESLL